MKIFITGGAGYIGSHTVLEALNKNHEVIVFDSFERGYHEPLRRIQNMTGKTLLEIKGDLRNINEIRKALNDTKPDCVIHFAAYKSVGEGEKEPQKYKENNVDATRNLLDAMVEAGVKKIIFSSSAATYGTTKELPITEDSPQNPISVYGRNKLDMEYLVEEYAKKHNMQAVAFRYFNAVGADESGEIGEDPRSSTNLVPLVMQTLTGKRAEVLLFGDKFNTEDGSQERDYIHVSDLADAHIKVAEKDLEVGALLKLNLSTGERTSCLKVFSLAEKISGRKLNYRVVEPRQGDPEVLYADSSKAQSILSWMPIRNIEKSIEDQWNWSVKNPDGYTD